MPFSKARMFSASWGKQVCPERSLVEQWWFVQPKSSFFTNASSMYCRDSAQLLLFGCGTCPKKKVHVPEVSLVSGYGTSLSLILLWSHTSEEGFPVQKELHFFHTCPSALVLQQNSHIQLFVHMKTVRDFSDPLLGLGVWPWLITRYRSWQVHLHSHTLSYCSITDATGVVPNLYYNRTGAE